jgi:hypothetical protein
LRSCIQRARIFALGGRINYRDLLPFVLNDDGEISQRTYIPFSIEILYSFCSERQCSLARWVDLRVKRHKDLNKFLLEFDIETRSDWAILNKAAKSHVDGQRYQEILTVFHDIYRRDRPQQHRNRLGGRCPEPTQAQLEAMIFSLYKRGININSPADMLGELETIAKILRQRSIWGQTGYPATESIERHDDEEQEFYSQLEVFVDPTSKEDLVVKLEQQELQEFCQQQLFECLDKAIKQGIADHISKQNKSRGYACLAHLIKPILHLIYCEAKSQAKIAQQFDISPTRLTHLVHPTNLLKNIRRQTVNMLLEQVLEKAKKFGYVQFPLQPDDFDYLMQQLEAYADEQVFQQAFTELKSSKKSAMESVYAQRLCFFLNEPIETETQGR